MPPKAGSSKEAREVRVLQEMAEFFRQCLPQTLGDVPGCCVLRVQGKPPTHDGCVVSALLVTEPTQVCFGYFGQVVDCPGRRGLPGCLLRFLQGVHSVV